MDRSPFQQTTAVERTPGGRYRSRVAPGWEQGRGAFGGVVLGTLLRAVEAEEGDARRRPRCLSGDICGPVLAGEVDVVVRALRRGSNQTNYLAELTQGGETLAVATVVTSAPRAVALPPVPPPASPARVAYADAPVIPVAPPLGPVFGSHFEFRSAGPYPFSGHPEAVSGGWIREKVRGGDPLTGADVVGLLDAWWPAFFATERAPRPMATVSFAAELLVDPATLDPGEPLYFRARVEGHADGFLVEFRELWRDDVLVAMNQQTFVVIR